jgi:hypothetical protein
MDNSSNEPQMMRTIQDFKPYIARNSAHTSISEALGKLLLKPLTKKETNKVGIVYVYWQPGNFGHVKIGQSQHFQERMKRWNTVCKKEIMVYFPKKMEMRVHTKLVMYVAWRD